MTSTYVVAWAEQGVPRPVGTVESVEAGKQWCHEQASQLLSHVPGYVAPPLIWRHYLSRGSGPGTAHYVADEIPELGGAYNAGTFEIWAIGSLTD